MTTSVALQHIINNPLNVQRNDCPAAFVGFQEEAVIGVVVEEILRQGGTTEGILQDEEVALPVGIAGDLATGSVAGPAAGRHPLLAVTGSVGVDRDQADIAFAQLPAPGVHTLSACPE